jgi:hypothetical protein
MSTTNFVESEILSCCALRFDGWGYYSQHGFDQRKALDNFFESGKWNLSALERLCMFFLLHRSLFWMDLTDEPKDGRHWQAFRHLFLNVAPLNTPEEYRIAKHAVRWESEYQLRLSEVIDFIREIHERYDSNHDPSVHTSF